MPSAFSVEAQQYLSKHADCCSDSDTGAADAASLRQQGRRPRAHPWPPLATDCSSPQGKAAGEVHAEPERDVDRLLQERERSRVQAEDDGCTPRHGVQSAPEPLVRRKKKERRLKTDRID